MVQVGLCLDLQTSKEAMHLFKESKSLLIANADSLGTGTVRGFDLHNASLACIPLQSFPSYCSLSLHDCAVFKLISCWSIMRLKLYCCFTRLDLV